MATRTIHLVCNAHLDPVWLWEWEEGAAEAISTFRTAADLCEQNRDFVFNHNEVVLYKWVEEYEPALFERIRRLVRRGQWRIMGGWYLQPDCNMPSGESFVRQILLGKRYFKEKFGVDVTTAINFDPFGHSWGLPQILAKSGYDSYLFCRPGQDDCPLEDNAFVWVGCDGSEVMARRSLEWYSSALGKAHIKLRDYIEREPRLPLGLLLWGVGNHGGGPSRQDLQQINRLIERADGVEIIHSTPEQYFASLARQRAKLPRYRKDLNPWGVGCYTSQVRIKQTHRRLENELYATEKMAATAAAQGLMKYPSEEIHEALCDLLVAEFHDILPGSSIQPVEGMSLRVMHHGLENLSRVKARAFFALAQGQPKARQDAIPILVYNPHPFKARTIVECELQLPDARIEDVFTVMSVYRDNRQLPSQVEQELSNLSLDWRKRVVFAAELDAGKMNRFDCLPDEVLRHKPEPQLVTQAGRILFKTSELDLVVNTRTGLVDRYRVDGVDYVGRGAFEPLVMADNEDPWGMTVRSFRKIAGRFKLMSRNEGTRFSGVTTATLPSVRIVEDGPVRSVIEAVLSCGDSFICQRYKLPKRGTEIEVETRVHWNEKNRCLKLSVPARIRDGRYVGQTAYGVYDLPANGDEAVAQKWVAVVSRDGQRALTCINEGTYGSDYSRQGLRLTLLRSPAYAGHPFFDRPIVVQDRYLPRIDQGERLFRFWFNAGPARARLDAVDREALVVNERPFALSFYPPGAGRLPKGGPTLDDQAVQITCFKKAEDGTDWIVRLFEPTGRKRSTTLRLPFVPTTRKITLKPFEIKTLRINTRTRRIIETDLMEKPLRKSR